MSAIETTVSFQVRMNELIEEIRKANIGRIKVTAWCGSTVEVRIRNQDREKNKAKAAARIAKLGG